MFRHRHQLRRWAGRVLLVWLFGIATGVAHASLPPSPMELGAQRSEPVVAVVAEAAFHCGGEDSQGAVGHRGGGGCRGH